MNTITINRLLLAVLAFFPISLFAEVETVFNGVKFYESLEEVLPKVKEIAKRTKVLEIKKPSFPLSKEKEQHLVCKMIETKSGTIESMVFTFSDDKLTYIEARGNAIESLINSREDSGMIYLGYKVFPKDLLFGDLEKDIVWMVTKEAAHPNLFTWQNPYLTKFRKKNPRYEASAKIPDFLKMGANIETLQPLLKANCLLMNKEKLDGSDPHAQEQINCFGVEYAGFPRKMECRFGDNQLNMVWILTAKEEEDRMRKKLTEAYGPALKVTDEWEVFNNWQVLLRKDKPEILVLTETLAKHYKKEFFKQ